MTFVCRPSAFGQEISLIQDMRSISALTLPPVSSVSITPGWSRLEGRLGIGNDRANHGFSRYWRRRMLTAVPPVRRPECGKQTPVLPENVWAVWGDPKHLTRVVHRVGRSVGSLQAPTARRRGQLCTADGAAIAGAGRCVSRMGLGWPIRERNDSAFDTWHPASPVPMR